MNANIASVIDLAMPILIALPPMVTRPPMLTPDTTHTLQLAPITPDVLIALMRATHSATGWIDELAVRAALPEEAISQRPIQHASHSRCAPPPRAR